MSNEQQNGTTEKLALGLGWFSIGLGLAELVIPGKVASLIGIKDKSQSRKILRFYGARELAAGVGILAQPGQPAWLWGRVGGDALDLTSLGKALACSRTNKTKAAIATAAVAGVTVLDVLCAKQLSNGSAVRSAGTPLQATKTILINKQPGEVYSFWRNFSNLATFMAHLESVQDMGNGRSIWRAKGPQGRIVEWQAEITRDEPDRAIAWRSVEGSQIPNSGSVLFQKGPGGRGTLVRVELEYGLPGGSLASALAKLFNAEPAQQVSDDLRILKQVLETGEVTKSDASIHPGMHPAQPPEQAMPVSA